MDRDEADDDHPAVARLLPFYVNGTLTGADRAEVEAALAVNPELGVELQAVREIADLVRRGGAELTAAVDAASPQRLKSLLAQIDGDRSTRSGARRLRLGRRRSDSGSRAPGALWKRAFAATLALALVQSGVLAYQAQAPKTYASLSGPEATKTSGQRLLLRVAPDARWTQIEALLAAHSLTLVGGPHGGMIEVSAPADARLDQEIIDLRASPLVTFAGLAT